MAEFLAGLADRRRVDERHIGRRVGHQDRVEEVLVARLKVRKHQVFLQIVAEIGDLGVTPRNLQIDVCDSRRQQTF